MKNSEFLEAMQQDIQDSNISEETKQKLFKNLLYLKEKKINLMITGATGCGKSSTINAMFSEEVAKVGVTPSPETMDISKFDKGNLILWDTPGLGDGKEKDVRHSKNIIDKLYERDSNGDLLIDLVLVILDGSSRDLGTSFELINNVIIPNLGENKTERIIVAINQADQAMKGRNWDHEKNKPNKELEDFLNLKVKDVKDRIKSGTGVDIEPIYYCAGYSDGKEQAPPYNLSKLLQLILNFTPSEKRIVYMENINRDARVWRDNDDLSNYREGILTKFGDTIRDSIFDGALDGEIMGSQFGRAGEVLGKVVGGFVGAVKGAVSAIGNFFSGGSSGGCYITTAICKNNKKPDDCYELTQFRNFRDNWLVNQPDGPSLIKRYYRTAPAIVNKIDSLENSNDIYNLLNENYLKKCLSYIENKEYNSCKKEYVNMMNYLYDKNKTW